MASIKGRYCVLLLLLCSLLSAVSGSRRSFVHLTNPAVGFEFTLDSVLGAIVSYDEGATLASKCVEGDHSYRALMRRWFDLNEQVHNGTLLPATILNLESERDHSDQEWWTTEPLLDFNPDRYWSDWIKSTFFGVKSQPVVLRNKYENDTDVKILTSMVSVLMKDLESALDDTISADKFLRDAVIGIPTFFYDSYKPDVSLDKGSRWMDEMPEPDTPFWAHELRRKFSVAVYRAGYERTSDSKTNPHNGEMHASTASAVPSVLMAINGAHLGLCPADSWEKDDCDGLWRGAPVTALNIDFSHSALTLYADRSRAPDRQWNPWNMWPKLGAEIGLSRASNEAAFWDEVGQKIQGLVYVVQTTASQGHLVKIILTGDALSGKRVLKSLRSTVETVLGRHADRWVPQTEPIFAASVGAARWARYERRQSLAPDICEFEPPLRLPDEL